MTSSTAAAEGGWRDGANATQAFLAMARGPTPMALTGLDGRWSDVNDALCELTGYPRDTLLRLSYQGLTHPEDLERDLESMSGLSDRGYGEFEMRKRLVHASGRTIWIDLWVTALPGADSVAAYLSQMRDVTAKVEQEAVLVSTHERFRRIFGDAPIGMVITDAERRLLQVNDAFCHMLGHAREALLGRPVEQLTHPDDRAADAHHHGQLARGGKHATREKRYLRTDGSVLWASVSTSRVSPGDDGATFIAQVVDISDTRNELEAVRDISAAFASTGDLDTLLRLICVHAGDITGAESTQIYLPIAGGESLLALDAAGPDATSLRGVRADMHSSKVGSVFRSGRSECVNDPATDPEIEQRSVRRAGIRSAVFVPIAVRDRTLGVLFCYNKRAGTGTFNERDQRVLERFAALAGVALEIATVVDDLKQSRTLALASAPPEAA